MLQISSFCFKIILSFLGVNYDKGKYTSRATLDVDFIDLGYPSKYGKAFSLLRDYDMLEFQSTFLKLSYWY